MYTQTFTPRSSFKKQVVPFTSLSLPRSKPYPSIYSKTFTPTLLIVSSSDLSKTVKGTSVDHHEPRPRPGSCLGKKTKTKKKGNIFCERVIISFQSCLGGIIAARSIPSMYDKTLFQLRLTAARMPSLWPHYVYTLTLPSLSPCGR